MIQQNKSLGTRLVSYWAPEVITTGIFHRQTVILCLLPESYVCVCVWGFILYFWAFRIMHIRELWVTGQMVALLYHDSLFWHWELFETNLLQLFLLLRNSFRPSESRLHHLRRGWRPTPSIFLFNFLPLLCFLISVFPTTFSSSSRFHLTLQHFSIPSSLFPFGLISIS